MVDFLFLTTISDLPAATVCIRYTRKCADLQGILTKIGPPLSPNPASPHLQTALSCLPCATPALFAATIRWLAKAIEFRDCVYNTPCPMLIAILDPQYSL